ncbi:MAG TPA: ATP-binding cassette domain-containing protein [Candidatus Xenobia bacterium]|jgi:ABC-2 type transport system ATP-binding protein
MEAVLECRSVDKYFRTQHAIQDFSFTVERGSICGLLGPNGAGKTSLIRMILDIFKPDNGEILLFGSPPGQGVRDRIGYLPEERGLYRRSKILDILIYLAALKNLPPARSRPYIEEQLEKVGLGGHMHKRTQELSKGMLQKVQIISAIVHQPEFLILDEPFSGLDPLNVQVVLQLIEEQRARGVTLLLSTHQMEIAERLADKLVMVHQGQRVLYGTLADIRAEHAEPTLHLTGPTTLPELPEGVTADRLGPSEWELAFGNRPRNEILSWLMERGVAVESFSLRVPSLEEIFLRKARGH